MGRYSLDIPLLATGQHPRCSVIDNHRALGRTKSTRRYGHPIHNRLRHLKAHWSQTLGHARRVNFAPSSFQLSHRCQLPTQYKESANTPSASRRCGCEIRAES
jgi:hypothetical protein